MYGHCQATVTIGFILNNDILRNSEVLILNLKTTFPATRLKSVHLFTSLSFPKMCYALGPKIFLPSYLWPRFVLRTSKSMGN